MFAIKTSYAGKLKALFDVLFSNMSTVCVTVSTDGISSEMSTTNNTLIGVDIPSSAFDEYVFTYDEPQYFGIGTHVNASFFKSLKNKTTVTMSMTRPYTLDMTAEDDGCVTLYSATVVASQNVSPAPVCTYDTPGISITCANFNTMCKSFAKSPSIDTVKEDGQLSFLFNLEGIASKRLTFGKQSEGIPLYHHQFKSDAFLRINKISSYADSITIFAETDKPMLVHATSRLGNIKIHMS